VDGRFLLRTSWKPSAWVGCPAWLLDFKTLFNANGILKQRYELSKQLQDLHIDVALFSETHLKPHGGFLFKIINFTETIANREEKAELPLQSKKASPQSCTHASPHFSRSYWGLHTYW
jgi:hypothetical protein